MLAAINAAYGSMLGGNIITSHQVDCMSSVLIPAEAVENDQEHIASCYYYNHTISLVTLCAKKPWLCLSAVFS